MKKKLLSAALALAVALAAGAQAWADGAEPESVRFTADGELKSSFGGSAISASISDMQPGDEAVFTIKVENDNAQTTDWYMSNTVLSTLEDGTDASGGAYTYELTYTDPSGDEQTLYSSDTVGGESTSGDREGLREATGALEDFFYLDTLASGQVGSVRLAVALDGETQGNDYQNTLADLQMNFAVEMQADDTPANQPVENPTGQTTSQSSGGSSSRTGVVKTGDEYDLVPYYMAMMASGVLFLLLALDSIRRRKKEARK